MANFILFDQPEIHKQLLPLTFTRPVSEIRCGIFTLREKWERYLGKASWLTSTYLADVFPCQYAEDNLYVNAALLPYSDLVTAINNLSTNESLTSEGHLLAARTGQLNLEDLLNAEFKSVNFPMATLIRNPWQIFQLNGRQILQDFESLKSTIVNAGVTDSHTIVYNPESVLIGKNVKIKAAVLNAEAGPIYIGDNCEVQEGSVIRGPFAMCEGSVINMGSKIKGDTTIGPYCKIGGEVSNSVIFGYSNKGHDGFLGNSVIGEWCNLGADTNTSNLKNNYSEVSIYSYAQNKMVGTGSQFCGLTMGDHSKAGINTMFNTGTVVGVSANVFEGDFPPKHVSSFSWGKHDRYDFDKAIETAKRVMDRRGKSLSPAEEQVLKVIFEQSQN